LASLSTKHPEESVPSSWLHPYAHAYSPLAMQRYADPQYGQLGVARCPHCCPADSEWMKARNSTRTQELTIVSSSRQQHGGMSFLGNLEEWRSLDAFLA
jgi:hypothetical protein